jgi:hypothetical protein
MDQIESLLKRPMAYNNIDGVGELGMGFMTLGFALIQWIQMHTPGNSAWHRSAFFIFMGVLAAIHYGSKAIKEHITYPRTGFVEYRKPITVGRSRIPVSLLAAGVSAALAVGLSFALRRHWDLSTLVSFIGLPFAASYAYGFARTAEWKWVVFGVLATGSFVIALLLPADLVAMLAKDSLLPGVISAKAAVDCWLTFVLYGVTFMISGAISFWLYLRVTNAPVEDTQ